MASARRRLPPCVTSARPRSEMLAGVCSPESAPKAIGWFEVCLFTWASPTAGRARTARAETAASALNFIAIIRLIPRD